MKQVRQFGIPLCLVAAAIGLAACGERVDSGEPRAGAGAGAVQNEKPMDSTRDPSMAGRDAALGTQNTAALGEAVKSQLARDPQLGVAPIQVEVVNGGQVALKGTAPTASARERAEQLAWTVKGVTKVDNQLTVVGS